MYKLANFFSLRLFCLLLFATNTLGFVQAQNLDQSFFSSDYEKKVFEKIADSVDLSPLDILVGIDYEENQVTAVKNKIKNLIEELRLQGIEKKTPKKQIQIIFNTVHNQILKRYRLDADFNQIFSKGEYNCVGASALYALIFEAFNIDFQIKELPTHVYIVGDPNGKNIMVESTDPSGGNYVIDAKEKQKIVLYLLQNKIIEQSELNATSIDAVYEKYYNRTKNITLKELTGIVYYNKGVFFYQEEEYKKAIVEMSKSYSIYPSSNSKYLLTAIYKAELHQQATLHNYDATTFVNYLNFCTNKSDAARFGLEIFNNFSLDKGINSPDIDMYKAFFEEVEKDLDKEYDLTEFKQIYYRVLAVNHYTNNEHASALNVLNAAFKLNSENLQTKEMIMEVGSRHLFTDTEHESSIDSIEKYMGLFPFLEENQKLQQYYTYCVLRSAYENHYFKKPIRGNELLDLFEKSIKSPRNFDFQEDYLTQIYGNISLLYIEKGQYSKATGILKRGLAIYPKSIPLNEQMKLLREYNTEISSNLNYKAPLSREELFKQNTKKYLSKCWKIRSVYDKNKSLIRTPVDINMDLQANHKTTYTVGAVTKSGKWSIRTKSRLLYLVSENDKSDYKMFKIETITANSMEIRSFNGKRMNSYTISMEVCR